MKTKIYILAIATAGLSMFYFLPHHAQAITPAEIIQQTNEYRAANGLTQLTENQKLDAAAKLKADDMLANQYWSHTSPTGVTPWHWFKEAGYYYETAGENLASYFKTTDQLMAAWEASPGHNKNLLGKDFKETGVAVVHGTFQGYETDVVVQLFGEPPVIHKTTPKQSLLKRRQLAIISMSGSQAAGVPAADERADGLEVLRGGHRLATQHPDKTLPTPASIISTKNNDIERKKKTNKS